MIDHVIVAGVVRMFLVAAVIFLALCRISNAIEEQKLARRVQLRLRQLIQSEDRIGITLTVTTFIYTVIFAILLVQKDPAPAVICANAAHSLRQETLPHAAILWPSWVRPVRANRL
jgi:hypothetical protein